jgi:hypothetical protein
MKITRLFILCLLLSHGIPVTGQDLIIGARYGVGSIHYNRQSDNYNSPRSLTNKAALVVEFSPFFSYIFFNSGIEFISNDYSKSLSIPLTIRLAFGTKIRPYIEGGGYYSYSSASKPENYIVKNDMGATAGIGLLFLLNKRVRLDAGYFRRYGFVPGLEEKILLPLEQVQYEKYKLHEGSFNISLEYRF